MYWRIWVIRKLSKRNLRAYKYHPIRSKFALQFTKFVPCMFLLHVSRSLLAKSSIPILHPCILNLSSSMTFLFVTHFGGYCAWIHDSSNYLGTDFFSESVCHRVGTDSFMLHSVHQMCWWRIHILSFTVSWFAEGEVSVSVVTSRPHATGFRRMCEGYLPDSFIFCCSFVFKS